LEQPAHTEVSGALTPEWAAEAKELDDNGVFSHMDLTDSLNGVFGNHSGANVVTAVFVRAGKTIAETVAKLIERGHVTAAVDKAADHMAPSEIDLTGGQMSEIRTRAVDMVAYKIAEFAKGWLAEKVLTDSDAMSKMPASNDLGEQDANMSGDYVQIKSVTLGYKPNGSIRKSDMSGVRFETTKNGVPVVFYQWDCDGGLWFGFDHTDVNSAAADVKGELATTISRTHSAYRNDEGRTYRKIWW
jgi:hypothetical protein